MRTAGKRPKALRARRIRPQDRRFVPVLMDRSRRPGSQLHAVVFPFLHQRAYRPVAGIFRKHCQQVPSRDICKKFFSIPLGVLLPGIRSSSHDPAREEYRPPANVLSLPVRIRQYPLRASSPVSPLSSPLIKQRGAAPPASCRQAPHELRPLPQRQIPQNAFPLRQYPSPQHNPRQHQDLIAARPAMEPREGPHALRDARVWSTNGRSSSSGDRRAREAHRPQIPLH